MSSSAQATGLRNGTRRFAPADVEQLFLGLRVPPPANVSQTLSRLRTQKLVLRVAPGTWALTPLGEESVRRLVGAIDPHRLDAELAGTPGADFAHALHPLIPPSFAPPRWQPGIARLLERFPFDENVFCMTRFPADDVDPVRDVVATVREVLAGLGLKLHLASDRQADDELFGNVGAFMWASRYGIGLLEDRVDSGLNYNVVIELGSMIMTGRRCTILKDCTAPELPTDLAGHIYKPVDFTDLGTVAQLTAGWVAEDLALA